MKKLLMVPLALIVLFYGCGTLSQTQTSVCNDIPVGETSVICEIATDIDVSPEYVIYVLKIGNVTALATEVYTAKKALAFVEDLQLFLTDAQRKGLTYAAIIQYAKVRYKELPEKVQIAFVVLQEFVNPPDEVATKLLTDYDYSILQTGLSEQSDVIRPFTVSE